MNDDLHMELQILQAIKEDDFDLYLKLCENVDDAFLEGISQKLDILIKKQEKILANVGGRK